VHRTLGIALIVASTALLLALGFPLRRRVPVAVGMAGAALAGAGLAAGSLLVQPHASAADWLVAVPAMALLAPAHIRIVLGRFGRAGKGSGALAAR